MTHNWWNRKNFVLVAAIASLVCVTAFVAVGLAFPEPVPSAALGPDWQCSRLAFVFTVCRRVTEAQAASVRVAKVPACSQPRIQTRS